MSAKDGGPAFPRAAAMTKEWEKNDSYEVAHEPQEGMTLRDYFAAVALAEMVRHYGSGDEAARRSYVYADAMLAVREES